jgi:tRNA (adenine22-N1)-methyltransferase
MSDRSARAGEDRLRALVEMVPPGSVVADIGTDHGLLPHRLLASGRAVRCIASEPAVCRLAKVRGFPPGDPRCATLSLRVGDGLTVLTPEDGVDVVVIAGLGGRAIAGILDHPVRRGLALRRLVLQPQSDPVLVRTWLSANGFRHAEERLVHDRRRFYLLIAAEPGRERLEHPRLSREDLLEAGPRLVRSRDPLVDVFWSRWLARHERILVRARSGDARDEAIRQRDLARRVLAALREGDAAAGPSGRD